LGQYVCARTAASERFALAQKECDFWNMSNGLVVLSSLDLAEGRVARAQERLQSSADIFRRRSVGLIAGWIDALLVYIAREQGQPEKARQYLCRALRTSAKVGGFFPAIYALPAAALLLGDEGQVEEAIELYALASHYPFVANSRWFADVAGREIALASTALSPERVDAARERGRARDLWATVEELLAELEER
jgi:hypothetical protein